MHELPASFVRVRESHKLEPHLCPAFSCNAEITGRTSFKITVFLILAVSEDKYAPKKKVKHQTFPEIHPTSSRIYGLTQNLLRAFLLLLLCWRSWARPRCSSASSSFSCMSTWSLLSESCSVEPHRAPFTYG